MNDGPDPFYANHVFSLTNMSVLTFPDSGNHLM